MTVLVCGSRTWTDRAIIAAAVAKLPRDTVIIHGGARGADTIAGQEANRRGLTVIVYPADWQRYGRSAGVQRNAHMLTDGKPDRVLAFAVDLATARGTADMVRRALAAGLPCDIVEAISAARTGAT